MSLATAETFRSRYRSRLDTELFDQLKQEADRRAIPVERLIEECLLLALPAMLAEAVRECLSWSVGTGAGLESGAFQLGSDGRPYLPDDSSATPEPETKT